MIKLTNFKDISKHLNVPAEAIAFVEGMTASTPNGKYPFGENCFVNVMDSSIKPREDRRAEAHNLYIDVQCLISGDERIYYTDRNTLTALTEYNPEKDVIFYALVNDAGLQVSDAQYQKALTEYAAKYYDTYKGGVGKGSGQGGKVTVEDVVRYLDAEQGNIIKEQCYDELLYDYLYENNKIMMGEVPMN
jgi:YhcH/YjgK/YiaL family protein